METKATVISTEGEFALVESKRRSACDGCHKQKEGSSCAMCTLMGDKAEFRTRARNPIGAKAGDQVMVKSPSGRVLAYGALVFLMPLLLGVLFYFLCSLVTASEPIRLCSALLAFGGAYVFLWLYSRFVISRRCDVTVTRILSSAAEQEDAHS